MDLFTPKQLTPNNNWGEELRQARLLQKLRIEDIAKQLQIRSQYLIALEEERLDLLPSGLYGKNFLKEYAGFLGLDVQASLKKLTAEHSLGEPDDPFSQKIIKKRALLAFPKIIRNILIGLGILICFLYLIFYFKKIILPPQLEVTNPTANILTTSTSLLINGYSEKEAEIRINNEIVLNNQAGFFSQSINLKKGLNNIVITAKKKYSREQTVIRQILVE